MIFCIGQQRRKDEIKFKLTSGRRLGGAERGERLGNEVMKQLCAAHTESAEQAGYTLLEYPNSNDTVGLIDRRGLETQLYYIIPGNDFLLLSFVISKMEVILPGQPASKGCSGWAKKQSV